MQALYFAHGNGFPALTYHKLLAALASQFEILYIDKIGHDPRYPVTDNWHYLVAEIIADITQKTSQPVVGVGHSLGGILLFLAAVQKPELFKSIILLDAPLLGFGKSYVIKWAKALGWMAKFTPLDKAKVRRTQWPDAVTALADFQNKALFKDFDPDCLNDYIQHGLAQEGEGLVLRFDRSIEANIYKTLPHTLIKYRKDLTVPAGIIYGKQSHVITLLERMTLYPYYRIKLASVPGSHLFPLEHPLLAAEAIAAMAKLLRQK